MVQLLVPLLAVALCLGVGSLALAGPGPVVVVGAPPLPATGSYDGAVELTFTLAEDHRGAVLEVRDLAGGARPVRRDLGTGAARVVVDQPGEHVLDWEVVCAGAATRGSTVVRVA
jgi:hypothetical protein